MPRAAHIAVTGAGVAAQQAITPPGGPQSGGQWAQQRVQSRYKSALQAGKTDYNWGQSKIKEAGNVWNSWTKSMENTVKHFCTTAKRVKKTSASATKTAGRTSGTSGIIQVAPLLLLEALLLVLGVASVSTLTNSGYKSPTTGKIDYTKAALSLVGITGDTDALILGAKIGYKQASDAIKQAVDKNHKKIADKIKSIEEGTSGAKGKEVDAEGWNKGSYDDAEESLKEHYKKHGKEVGAESEEEYLRKAKEYARTAKKGSTKSKVDGEVEGVIRYKKNGKYIDIAPDGSIISYGKQ